MSQLDATGTAQIYTENNHSAKDPAKSPMLKTCTVVLGDTAA